MSYDDLVVLIKRIGVPSQVENLSTWSKAKRTVNHAFSYYPKTMISGVSEISVGTAVAVSYKLYENFGEAANQWIYAQTGLNVRVEYVASISIAAVGAIQTAVTLAKSTPKVSESSRYTPRFHQPTLKKNNFELDSVVVDERQEQRLGLISGKRK